MPKTGISIVIPTYGRARYLTALVDSIRKFTPQEAYEIIVVSSEPPETEKVKWLAAQEDIELIQPDVRRGGGRKNSLYYYSNLGIKRARKEWVFLMNDDMEVPSDWYGKFSALAEDPKNGDVGMVIVAMHFDCDLGVGTGIIKTGRIKKPGEDWKDTYSSDLSILRKSTWEKLGYLDEKMDWFGSGQDVTLAMEFVSSQRTLLAPEVKIRHLGVAENRKVNNGNIFKDTHYVEAKWREWCRRNGGDFESAGDVGAYTLFNRLKYYVQTKCTQTLPDPVLYRLRLFKRSLKRILKPKKRPAA